MIITATELKANIGKYLHLAEKENIYVTKNGRRIVKLTGATEDIAGIVKSLIGVLPESITENETRKERLAKYENHD